MFLLLSCALPPSDYHPVIPEYYIADDCLNVECFNADQVTFYDSGLIECTWGCVNYQDVQDTGVTLKFNYSCTQQCYILASYTLDSDTCWGAGAFN